MAKCARSRELRADGGVLDLEGSLAIEQPTEVESQVAEVVWLAHVGSSTMAAPDRLADCSPPWIPNCSELSTQTLPYLVLHAMVT